MDLKERIAKTLSEILSDKYEAKITIRFESADTEGGDQHAQNG